MAVWFGLCENEALKLLRRRRPQLVLVLLAVFLGISVWAQHRQQQLRRDSDGEQSWRAVTERRVHDAERRASQRRIFIGFNRLQAFEAARLRYHLARDINPNRQTGPLTSRGFAALASSLLLRLSVCGVTSLVMFAFRAAVRTARWMTVSCR
jgi:hypothetical protein